VGAILFYKFYFPKEKLLKTVLFLSTKWRLLMLLTCVLGVSNLKYKYLGLTPKFSGKRNFSKIKKIMVGQFLRGGWAGMIIYQLS
jgi:hypothetical protein